jgi:hypothetical protein
MRTTCIRKRHQPEIAVRVTLALESHAVRERRTRWTELTRDKRDAGIVLLVDTTNSGDWLIVLQQDAALRNAKAADTSNGNVVRVMKRIVRVDDLIIVLKQTLQGSENTARTLDYNFKLKRLGHDSVKRRRLPPLGVAT